MIQRFQPRMSRPRVRKPGKWTAGTLERRLMLAADAGAALAEPACPPAEVGCESMPTDRVSCRAQSSSHIVFVDPGVDDMDDLLVGVDPSSEIVLLDAGTDGVTQITNVLASRRDVSGVHLIAHGRSGEIVLGGQTVTDQTLTDRQAQLRQWSAALMPGADILLYSCETAQGPSGQRFVSRLASLTGADVAASVDKTGHVAAGGDWDLEHHVGSIESALVIDAAARSRYQAVLPITIRAAGVTNEETMQVQIDGTTVATFENVGGNAYGRQFETYTVDIDGVSADQLRIAFTNDFYDEAGGIDRNLRIDSVTIDSVTYEAEHPSVFSTGTWLEEDGVVAGFRESELLTNDGYFQFAELVTGNGSTINISASGSTGEETMELWIDGTQVQTFANVDTDVSLYTYQAEQTVTADQIQLFFTNDLYDESAGIDRNLTVDSISVDGQVFQSEADTVYSTGTWLSADGITPGFGRGDTLHGNGYFQYDADAGPEPVPGSIGLTLSSITIDEDLGSLNVIVFRGGGSDGSVSVDYTTNIGTADGSDFQQISGTLTFDDGVTGQQLSLQITDDALFESDESFSLSIFNPTGGATLDAITTQVVTIVDNDQPVVGVIFQDSFESTDVWVTNPLGTDTATTGQWVAGAPQQTTSGSTTLQLDRGHTGSRALITGLAAGGSVGTYDIDNGVTSVVSPPIELPGGAEIELSFEYYLAYLNNASNDDFFRAVLLTDGQEIELFDDHAHASNQSASWQQVVRDLSPYAGQTVQIMFQAADALGPSLVEAGVDDVVVEVLPNLPGTIEVATTSVNLDESAGSASVLLRRSVGRAGEVTVDYTTVAGSAGTGDFSESSGTVTFADGQSEATVVIGITDDNLEEDLESFELVLSNVTGGANLGSADTATITIADNDSTVPDYLPDMTPVASTLLQNLSIDNNEIPGRRLMRFSTEVANVGDGPLEIWGGTASGNSQQVFQRIYQSDGGSRDRLAGEFVYHPGHGHIHFEGFASYNLRLVDASGNVIASGGKTSFCLINIRQPFPDVTDNAGRVHGRGGNSCGDVQGISAGYSDVYSASLDDQWIDVTGVADGQYWLEIIADPDNNIQEIDETNNTARVLVNLSGNSVSGA